MIKKQALISGKQLWLAFFKCNWKGNKKDLIFWGGPKISLRLEAAMIHLKTVTGKKNKSNVAPAL